MMATHGSPTADGSGTAELSLGEDFWTRFFAQHWDTTPGLFRKPFAVTLASPEEVFRGLMNRTGRVRFYVENMLVQGNEKDFDPVADDGSLAGYGERVTRLLAGRRWGLIMNDFTAGSYEIWSRLRQFLRVPLARLGLPAGTFKAQVALFVGNYGATPFGAHVDAGSVFMFVLQGAKRMRFWPGDFAGRPQLTRRLDYQDLAGASTALEGERGDLIFWPRSHLHVGEAVDDGAAVTVSASLSLFEDGNDAELVTSLARGLIEKASLENAALRAVTPRFYPSDPGGPAAQVATLPESIRSARALLRKVGTRELDRALVEHWARLVSSYGFHSPPPLREVAPLSETDRIRADVRFPVLSVPVPGRAKSCYVAANGHCLTFRDDETLRDLLSSVNSGEVITIPDCIARYGSEVVLVLQWLLSTGTIDRV